MPLFEIKAHNGDVDDLDVSADGCVCISVGHDTDVCLWNAFSGDKLLKLAVPPEIGNGFRVSYHCRLSFAFRSALCLDTCSSFVWLVLRVGLDCRLRGFRCYKGWV